MFKLQALRIPAGWEVVLNKLLEIDVTCYPVDSDIWIDFTEDITYIRKKGRKYEIGIDLGWYPDTDPSGAFHIKVIVNENWEKPILEYVTRKKEEVVNILEKLLLRYCSEYNIFIDLKNSK